MWHHFLYTNQGRGIISSEFNGQDWKSIQLEKNVRELGQSSRDTFTRLTEAK